MPKAGLPPAYVISPQDLLDKRLSRPVRVEETFNPHDLVKGGLTLPEGYDMVSIRLDVSQAAGGFVDPGSRVNVSATLRTAETGGVFYRVIGYTSSGIYLLEGGMYPQPGLWKLDPLTGALARISSSPGFWEIADGTTAWGTDTVATVRRMDLATGGAKDIYTSTHK